MCSGSNSQLYDSRYPVLFRQMTAGSARYRLKAKQADSESGARVSRGRRGGRRGVQEYEWSGQDYCSTEGRSGNLVSSNAPQTPLRCSRMFRFGYHSAAETSSNSLPAQLVMARLLCHHVVRLPRYGSCSNHPLAPETHRDRFASRKSHTGTHRRCDRQLRADIQLS